MAFDRFPYKPQIKVQVKRFREQVVMSFGNGYEEILNKDPHGELREYSLTYSHLRVELLPLINFLENHSNGTPFIFLDPITHQDVTVYIKGGNYNIINESISKATISCTLRETRRYASR